MDPRAVTRFTVAAAQYPVDRLDDWQAYAGKIARWVEEAAEIGATLLVFPEYGGMELASLHPETMGDLHASLHSVAALADRAAALHADLAVRHGVHIVAPSMPEHDGAGAFVNRARIHAPSGRSGYQDKIVMTRFEREQWSVGGSTALRVFDTELGKVAINICYDSEFPLIARAVVTAGAQMIAVPSCTDTLQGYWRVRLGCQARALEGQCFVVQSPTVGRADWSPAVDVNRGAAGIFAPPDGSFPDDGVIALGDCDMPQWLFGEVDTAAVDTVRREGAVLNRCHWQDQPGATVLPPVECLSLRGA